jgi:hypothetical protein
MAIVGWCFDGMWSQNFDGEQGYPVTAQGRGGGGFQAAIVELMPAPRLLGSRQCATK